MERRSPWISVLLVASLLIAALGLAAAVYLPGDEELRDKAIAEVRARYGMELNIASARWRLLPVPSVVLRDASTGQPQPISVRRLSATLNVSRTLRSRRIILDSIAVDGAVLPTVSLAAFQGQARAAGEESDLPSVLHLRFRNVVWISRTGTPLPVEGEIDFDPHWRPRHAQVRRARFDPPARLTLEREAGEDRWSARVALGGGTANGRLGLTTGRDGMLVLGGALAPSGIEVASAVSSLNRRSPVSGKANGHTTVSASGRTVGELGRSLRLLTEFRIAPATILRVDVDKAVRTLGISRDGQTPLRALTGSMELQNTARGTVLRFTGLTAEADGFTATGEGSVFNRQVDARGTLHLVSGIIAVPFAIHGPVRKAQVVMGGGGQQAVPAAVAAPRELPPDPGHRQRPAGVRNER